jgi:ferrous iron transport protein B
VVPLMTCSARLPVYTLIIAALFPPSRVWGLVPVQGLLLVGMYLFNTVTALGVAALLGRTMFKGRPVPLLIEMPPYRRPHWGTVAAMMWRRSRVFLTQAGTVILLCSVGMWLLLTFPRAAEATERYAVERARVEESTPEGPARGAALEAVENARAAEALTHSFGGRLGHLLEPGIAPLGFDWKIGIGLLGAFAAREVFISTMGVVYGMGRGVDEGSAGLRERLRAEAHADGRPVYTPLVGASLLVFFALACQCMSTLAVVRRETRSFKWPAFLFGYTLGLAWVAAFVVYQGGRLLGLG